MLTERGKQVRRDAIVLAREHGGTHFGGSLSCVEILIALFDKVMTEDDVFILSKGHGCWAYYAILRERGMNPKLEIHPTYDPKAEVHSLTGSLGHGLPFGIGIAMAKKIKGEPGRVFVLMGDGECQEGTFWESLLVGARVGLQNLTLIIDSNGCQGSGRVDERWGYPNVGCVANLCGWEHVSDVGGNDEDGVRIACRSARSCRAIVVAHTVKGSGVSFMEDRVEWHSKVLTDEQFRQAMDELK